MKNEIIAIDYSSKETIEVLRQILAVGATDTELSLFIEICKSTGLNPFKKEIWFIKTKGKKYKDEMGNWQEGAARLQIMTGINGFLAIANNHPQFDGLECEVFYAADKRTPLSAVVKVHRKDRKFPSVATALWHEYYKPNKYGNVGIWEQIPSIMIAKCAKSLALREAFPQELNGLYTQEEMSVEDSPKAETVKPERAKLETIKPLPFEDDQLPDFEQEKAQKKAGEETQVETWTEPSGVYFQYNLEAYSHKSPEHKEMFFKKLAQKKGVEVSLNIWEVPELIEGLKQYLIKG